MNRNYIFLTLLMLLLAAGTFFIKKEPAKPETKPEALLLEIIQPTRFVTTDQVARMIIQKDPSLELIDVRSPREFAAFSLPGAINIPIDSIQAPSNDNYFGISGIKIVFISDDGIKADQEWVLARRMGYRNMYVMKGGLNRWIETIIQPKEPGESQPYTAFEQYEFRKGAQLFFTGAKVQNSTTRKKVKVVLHRKKKKTVVSGGC
jgi:rhodanese-related sulfurtransferase